MSLPPQTTVAIIGAGPAGLAAAITLTLQGCKDIIVVDALEKGENSSRALMIHAATLELLDTIGCAAPLIEAGIKVERLTARQPGGSVILDLDTILLSPHTRYPFILTLPQHETERILGQEAKKLGITVLRPFKLVGLSTHPSEPKTATLTFEAGETMKAQYVVAADGARSLVRTLSGIGFTNPDGYEGFDALSQMLVADVILSHPNPLPDKGVWSWLSPDNLLLIIPLRPKHVHPGAGVEHASRVGASVFRLVSGVPLSRGVVPHAPSMEYIQGLLDDYCSDPVKGIQVVESLWSTRFRTHSSIASQMCVHLSGGDGLVDDAGPVVYLVGDAAHIHSPAGGQGMNLGLRDAIALGPVLAAHISATNPAAMAEAERALIAHSQHQRTHALNIIKFTKGILGLSGAFETTNQVIRYWRYIGWFVKINFIRFLGRFERFRMWAVLRLSGVEIK